ncbi:hypothetical protein ACFY12_15040 [Streptomyces sp. NPDC001339]|uniref:hypothetical protein n=1 Tax=Streptomyces sp. NPDC001339 TaxID=3364563 RepID=UPI0036CCB32E
MGCDTSALATHTPAAELAQWLRSLRRRSGVSYRQMARLATLQPDQPVPHLRFFQADRGNRLPAWAVVQDYVRVCGGDVRHAERLWKKAHTATATPGARPRRRRTVLPPQYICEPIELLDAMRALRFAHGNKTLRELELAATENGVSFLPRSSLGAVLSGKRMPSKALLLTFVRVCGGVEPGTPQALLWEQARERADAHRRGRPTPTIGQRAQTQTAQTARTARTAQTAMTTKIEQTTQMEQIEQTAHGPETDPQPAAPGAVPRRPRTVTVTTAHRAGRPARSAQWRRWAGRLLHQVLPPDPHPVAPHGN